VVKVLIDETGKVVAAAPVDTQGLPADSMLVRFATDAARGWKFQPGAVGGRPVRGEAVLRFRFTK
jgi:hypothetical protein